MGIDQRKEKQVHFEKLQQKTPDIPAWRAYNRGMFGSPASRGIGYIIALILAVLGILCLFFVDLVYKLLPYIMGSFMTVTGMISIVGAFFSREYERLETKRFSSGIILLVVGISIVGRGKKAQGLIGAAWGIFGLFQGSESLNVAVYGLVHKEKWLFNILQAMVQILLALLLLMDPVSKLYPHMRILGLGLLSMGLHIFCEIKASVD